MTPGFEKFFRDNEREVKEVQSLLSIPLSDAPSQMVQQVLEIESHYGTLTSLQAHADYWLDMAEKGSIQPKNDGKTDFDRQIDLAAAVSLERRFRDVCVGLAEAVAQRIMLSQSLLRATSREGRFGVGT